jgi:hypothetical protein
MATFIGRHGSSTMMSSASLMIDSIEMANPDIDIHTVTLVLNGQHGEFDLVVEATDGDMEDRRWTGIAYRTGGVSEFKEVDPL